MKKLFLLMFLVLSSNVYAEIDPVELKEVYMQRYCIRFEQIPSTEMDLTINELGTTPYKVDDYFEHSLCQTRGYSPAVKSPMIHYVADDVTKNEDKLDSVLWYYTKKRKQPEMFTWVINVENTKGETLLDYIEKLKNDSRYGEETLKGPVARIVEMLCSHGGVYSYYNKSCSN